MSSRNKRRQADSIKTNSGTSGDTLDTLQRLCIQSIFENTLLKQAREYIEAGDIDRAKLLIDNVKAHTDRMYQQLIDISAGNPRLQRCSDQIQQNRTMLINLTQARILVTQISTSIESFCQQFRETGSGS